MHYFFASMLLFTILFPEGSSAERVDFTRHTHCVKSTYLCGQCEGVAEISTQELLKDLIGKSVPMTKVLASLVESIEAKLDFPLIPILIGHSPSLMRADSKHPKVILKSPESEFLIAFNTDSKSEAYETIETIRFEGKTSDFKFEQVVRDSAGKIRVNQNPSTCFKCHGNDPHPLWDTYRAWPGVFAARDDLIEKGSAEELPFLSILKLTEKQTQKGVTHDWEKRLGLLHLPLSKSIEKDLKIKSWSRIPHYPPTFQLKNRSLRSAEYAGPSHLLFDQLSAELGCYMMKRIQNSLTLVEFKKMQGALETWEPGGENKMDGEFFTDQRTFSVLKVIQTAAAKDQEIKVRRQVEWLKTLGASDEKAWDESYFLKIPFQSKWFAVPDPGGVLGVPEADLPFLASLEVLLIAHHQSLANWSMSVGPNVDSHFKSFSFSDQFIRSIQSITLEVNPPQGVDSQASLPN